MSYHFVVSYESLFDHKPIMFFLGDENNRHYLFRFNKGWLNDESFKDMVRSVWIHIDNSTVISPMEQFSKNLKLLKRAITSG